MVNSIKNNSAFKILAIETATPAFSVALRIGAETSEHFAIAPMRHAALILPTVKELLSNAELSINQLDAIAVSNGPGGFTSVRLGVSVVQGLAFAADLPVIPVSTLQTLAQSAHTKTQAKNILVALDARMNEIYWSAYALNMETGIMENINEIEDSLRKPENIILPKDFANHEWLGAGSGWLAYGAKIQEICHDFYNKKNSLFINELHKNTEKELPLPNLTLTSISTFYQIPNLTIDPEIHPHACDTAKIAALVYQKGLAISATELTPFYLRDAVQQ